MISGGVVSVYVSDMDKAIAFYNGVMGFAVQKRIGDEWAEIDCGEGLIIGLHIAHPPQSVTAGTIGAINVELRVTEPMEAVVSILTERGGKFVGPIANYENVRIASISDPDQNIILLAQVLH